MNICAECKYSRPSNKDLGLLAEHWICTKNLSPVKTVWGRCPVTGNEGWMTESDSLCIDRNDGTCPDFELNTNQTPWTPSNKSDKKSWKSFSSLPHFL